MAYELRAVIGAEEPLRASTASLPGRVVPLAQGFAMLLLTDELVRAVTGPDPDDRLPGIQMLPPGFHRTLAGWSVPGPLAYVQCESHAGVILQEAAVWDAGALVATFQTSPSCTWPVSQALRRLGVGGGREGWDEFDVLGLGRHRHTKRWTDTPAPHGGTSASEATPDGGRR